MYLASGVDFVQPKRLNHAPVARFGIFQGGAVSRWPPEGIKKTNASFNLSAKRD